MTYCVYRSRLPPNRNSRFIGYDTLANSIISGTYGLQDIWRNDNPHKRDFTHWSNSTDSGARSTVGSCLLPSSDFSPVPLLLLSSPPAGSLPITSPSSSPSPPRPSRVPPAMYGRGLSGFPLFLLNIPEAEQEFALLVRHQVQPTSYGARPPPLSMSGTASVRSPRLKPA